MLQVKDTLKPPYQIAAQNSWVKGTGAYTGEIAPELLVDLGIGWATWQDKPGTVLIWRQRHGHAVQDIHAPTDTALADSEQARQQAVGHACCSIVQVGYSRPLGAAGADQRVQRDGRRQDRLRAAPRAEGRAHTPHTKQHALAWPRAAITNWRCELAMHAFEGC